MWIRVGTTRKCALRWSTQEKVPFEVGNNAFFSLNTGNDKEGIDAFMSFKETSTNIYVDIFCDVVDQNFKALFKVVEFLAVFNRSCKEMFVVSKRILIHIVNT